MSKTPIIYLYKEGETSNSEIIFGDVSVTGNDMCEHIYKFVLSATHESRQGGKSDCKFIDCKF